MNLKNIFKSNKCPKCNKKINKEFDFCVNCGFNFNEENTKNMENTVNQVCEEVGYVCSNCGAEISEGMQFCLECGLEIDFGDTPLSVDSDEFETVFGTGEIKTIDTEFINSVEKEDTSSMTEKVYKENSDIKNMNSYFKSATKF